MKLLLPLRGHCQIAVSETHFIQFRSTNVFSDVNSFTHGSMVYGLDQAAIVGRRLTCT